MRLMRLAFSILVLTLAVVSATAQDASGDLAARAKSVLSPLEGTLTFPGLKEPVEVLRDRWGIAHIYAKNQDDLFFAQGVVVAQDRLFQIDWWRRVSAGETAEVLGPTALEGDRFARLIRYRGDMDREWTSYAHDTRAIATAFTRGINAWIDHIGDRLPIEFQLLKYRPKRWQPEDILGRMSGIIMSRNIEQEIARARLIAAVGVEKARLLAPTDPPIPYAAAPELDLGDATPAIYAGYKAATKSPNFKPSPSESNNWVVDGKRSASGKPMLASDPHRTIAVPSLRYLVHLNAPGWNVIGSGEPALPGVALGHNERIAWGFTIVGTDQADIFVEKTDPEDPRRYLTESGWEKMTVVRESVRVAGKQEPVEIELRYTRHGPVVHQDEKKRLAFALKWAGSEPGGAAYLGSLSVARAHDQPQFLRALEAWKIPCLNFVYADRDGRVGWVAAALTPMRRRGNGLVFVPGWTGTHEWHRFLDVRDLPQRFDPPEGWIATANHNILPKNYDREIAYEWAPPHRFLRIREVLEKGGKFTLEDFERLQHDVTSIPGRTLGKLLAQVPDVAPEAKLLIGWNGELSRDSKAGPLYATWLQELNRAIYAEKHPKIADSLKTLNNIGHMLGVLENPSEAWFGPDPKAGRDRLMRETFARAVERTGKLLGPDPKTWRWGKLHTTPFHHPLSTLSPDVARAFDLGPVERMGDVNTPNNTRHDDSFRQVHGASYRHVLDLADWDRGKATSAPGQSGQPGSPHYGDLLPLWAEGQYFPLAYSRPRVEEVTTHRTALTPARR